MNNEAFFQFFENTDVFDEQEIIYFYRFFIGQGSGNTFLKKLKNQIMLRALFSHGHAIDIG